MWLYEVLNEGTDDFSNPVILVLEVLFFLIIRTGLFLSSVWCCKVKFVTKAGKVFIFYFLE